MTKLLDQLNEEEKKSLIEHLPDGQQNEEALKDNLLSPQLKQAMDSLTEAVKQDPANVQMIMAMCDLDMQLLNTSQDGMEALFKGFIQKYSKQ